VEVKELEARKSLRCLISK